MTDIVNDLMDKSRDVLIDLKASNEKLLRSNGALGEQNKILKFRADKYKNIADTIQLRMETVSNCF